MQHIQHRSNGTIWKAGDSILGLCAAYNHATDPGAFLSEHEHKRTRQYARAIKNRMKRLGFTYGPDYTEWSNGMLWPLNRDRLNRA